MAQQLGALAAFFFQRGCPAVTNNYMLVITICCDLIEDLIPSSGMQVFMQSYPIFYFKSPKQANSQFSHYPQRKACLLQPSATSQRDTVLAPISFYTLQRQGSCDEGAWSVAPLWTSVYEQTEHTLQQNFLLKLPKLLHMEKIMILSVTKMNGFIA